MIDSKGEASNSCWKRASLHRPGGVARTNVRPFAKLSVTPKRTGAGQQRYRDRTAKPEAENENAIHACSRAWDSEASTGKDCS